MREGSGGGLLLDTHVWIWTVEGATADLAPAAVRAIRAAGRRGDLLVSAISIWEVSMLEARDRIRLARPLEDWVLAAVRAPGTRLLDLSPEILIESTRLPGTPPQDPADRMLVAAARRSGATLVTRDRRLLDYADAGHVAVFDARP